MNYPSLKEHVNVCFISSKYCLGIAPGPPNLKSSTEFTPLQILGFSRGVDDRKQITLRKTIKKEKKNIKSCANTLFQIKKKY